VTTGHDAALWESMVTVGRIVRPHGHKGAVMVEPATDFATERFREGAELNWTRGGEVSKVRVAAGREFRGRWVVMFDGVESMNDAETLRGLELRVAEADLHPLDAGTHYVHDLEGCEVTTLAGERIGRVERVQFGSSAPLLVVGASSGEVLVPLVDGICRRIDPASKRIIVELPEGLIELNASRKNGRER
jgi:16S rRNA processing protein RimM